MEDLRTSEIRYRRLFESARDGILILDGYTHRITDSNPYMTELLGHSHADFLGKELWEIGLFKDKAESQAAFQTLKDTGYVRYDDIPLQTTEGEVQEVEFVCNTYQESAKLVVQCDIRSTTERKELEAQLFQSQKMEAIGVLAGGIAHDFNNLLTVINGYSHMALRKLLNEDPLRKYLEEINAAGELASALTGQLLTFSRRQVLQQVVLNVNSIVSSVRNMLERIVREDIRFETTLCSELANIRADPGQIEQVIMNLAINSRDAMVKGGVLKIGTENVVLDDGYIGQTIPVAPGPFVKLTVSDTGAGMDKETRRRIFEPFFTTKELGEGTGLGLSTVHGIVRQAGGDIRVSSTLGEGTVFEIYLPSVAEEVPRSKVVEGGGAYEGTETILLAEDETIVRKLIYAILTDHGYKVLEARDGAEALEICNTHDGPIHLLLTDLIMPNMGGIELSRGAALHCPDMKTIFMSGYTDDTASLRGALDKEAGFIGKPFSPADLARTVRETLN
jgi:PAS domain S-box-containing protein